MISSDEDPDSANVSEGENYIINTDALQTSLQKLQNIGANEISSLVFPNQSDHSYSMAAETNVSPRSFVNEENKFFAYESETFKKFISVVLPAEPDENDRARIAQKLNKYCQLADPKYIRSPEFDELLEKGVKKIIEDPSFLYYVLRDVKDNLLLNKAELFTSFQNTEDEMLSSGENIPENPSQDNSSESDNLKDVDKEERKHEIVNKLTALLKKVDEKIKELEELEVDFSDEEDSSYFKMQRYRERFCEVYEKLCTYTNKPLNGNRVGGIKKINFSDTDNLELNRAIEKWLNKTRQFPDYSDVNKFMIEVNQSLNLKLTKEQIKIKAQQIFENIGNNLQRRRHFDLWDSLSSFLSTDVDPAVKNPELESVLKKNYELGIKKEKELLRYYAERQEKEKLQPREVPDEEANCSPAESDDENEEEMNIVGNMLDSKISTDDEDGDGYDGSDEAGNDESDHNSFRFLDSNTANEGPSKMVVKRKARVENNDPQRFSVSNDNCEHIDGVGSKGINSLVCVNSETTETVGTNTGTIPVEDGNTVGVIPNKQDTEDNLVRKSENFMKRKNENLNENDNDSVNIHPCKKFLEEKEKTETRNFEETEISNKSDSDSDCEIVEIILNNEGEDSKDLSLKRKVYQVNYAFTNNNFNYNTVLSSNVLQKKHCFPSNYKNVKNQKQFHDFPANELTNIKSIANKNALPRENKVKKKSKNTCNKQKSLNSITCQTSKDSDLKNNDLAISTSTNSINCSLQQEKSGENMKSQKEVNKTNQNNDLQQGSNNETTSPPNGGSSSGGNGQDNSENNGNKKPSGRETQTEDNPENEDNEEDEEEDADTPEENPPETPKVNEAVPKLIISRTNQKEQKVSGAAVFKLPPTEKVTPVRRNSLGKQLEKPPGIEITQRKEPIKSTPQRKGALKSTPQRKETLNSTPTTRSSRAKQTPVRKRKVNQNEGAQGTPRQGKSNVFTFHFQKGPAELKKRKVNKAIPAASSSKDDDVEIIQVTKKKRSAPVKQVQSDEEIVKNFLERSNPSISITTPKKKAVQNEPPPSVVQALETLSRLKGISVVKNPSKGNTDEEITIISESLNTRANKILKQQKTPASSATATATATMPHPVATATATMPHPVATATATMPPPVATATTSLEPLMPKIVTVQGNVQGFDDIVDGSIVIQDNLPQNYIQKPQASLVNVSGIKTDYNERFYNPQAHLVNVSATTSNYNEQFYSSQASVATVPGSASTLQENLYGSQAPAASISGSTSTYQENFTGTVECVPVPRYRNVRSSSKSTPKKTKTIEYVILD